MLNPDNRPKPQTTPAVEAWLACHHPTVLPSCGQAPRPAHRTKIAPDIRRKADTVVFKIQNYGLTLGAFNGLCQDHATITAVVQAIRLLHHKQLATATVIKNNRRICIMELNNE